MDHKIVTLCGSTRFKKEFEEWNRKLTASGYLVFTVACFTHAENLQITEQEKEMFDKVHLAKINKADEIFVIDVDGYIGKSTQREIDYARKYGKKIRFLSQV